MAIRDFYQSQTKKFDVVVYYRNAITDIRNDDVIFYMKENKSDTTYIMTQSADVAISGSAGVAQFNLTPAITELISPGYYYYEIKWLVSGSNDEYVLDESNVRIKQRVKNI